MGIEPQLERFAKYRRTGDHAVRNDLVLYLELSACIELLGHELGRPARVDEIADAMRTSIDEVLEAMEAGAAYRSTPLSQASDNDDDSERADGAVMSETDATLEGADARMSVRVVVSELPERERKVVYLRFFEGRTQSEIAAQVGVSQVHVSRIFRDTLHRLGDRLGAA